MARAKYPSGEMDGPTQIENGIREALAKDGRAIVTIKAIENVFEMVDDQGVTIDGDVGAKCSFLCDKFDCTCATDSVKGECTFSKR